MKKKKTFKSGRRRGTQSFKVPPQKTKLTFTFPLKGQSCPLLHGNPIGVAFANNRSFGVITYFF